MNPSSVIFNNQVKELVIKLINVSYKLAEQQQY